MKVPFLSCSLILASDSGHEVEIQLVKMKNSRSNINEKSRVTQCKEMTKRGMKNVKKIRNDGPVNQQLLVYEIQVGIACNY